MINNLIIFCAEYLIYILTIFTILYVLLNHSKKDRLQHVFIILLSTCAAWVVSHILKDLIAHPRPPETFALVKASGNSFPSGHTTYSFALAFSTYLFNKKIGFYLLIVAAVIGVSRVLAGVHYWYDIVGGIIIGMFVAYIVTKIAKKYIKDSRE